ncbi:tyrosine-type recombinase/integrase [Muricoccus aerilatus]|nr:tyrosine-type recombinase/integrase [Roseomonas aerilata]
MRHTWAIRVLQKGSDIYAVSRHLGHSNVRTTEIHVAWLRDGWS